MLATSTSYTPQYLVLIFLVSSQVVKIMKLVNKVYDVHISTMTLLLIYVLIFQNDIIRI